MEKLPQKVPSKWKSKRALGRLLLKTFMGPSKPKMVCYGKNYRKKKEQIGCSFFLINILLLTFPFHSFLLASDTNKNFFSEDIVILLYQIQRELQKQSHIVYWAPGEY